MLLVHAHNQVWPIETFLDAHRYERVGDVPAIADSDWPILCVTNAGEVIETPARQAPWGEVIAIRAPDLSCHFDECSTCGAVAEISYANERDRTTGKTVTVVYEHCPRCSAAPDWDDDRRAPNLKGPR